MKVIELIRRLSDINQNHEVSFAFYTKDGIYMVEELKSENISVNGDVCFIPYDSKLEEEFYPEVKK
jgi:hypothetical protein